MRSRAMVCAVLLGISANAIAQGDFSPEENAGTEASKPPAGSTGIPESAMRRYGRGDAPFYVRVRVYARNLDRALTRPIESLQRAEMEILGLSIAELEEIHGYLQVYRNRDDEFWPDGIATKCPEIARNELGNAEARAFIAQLDDREAVMNELANDALQNVATEMGLDVRDKLLARINEAGESILFTSVDEVTRIDSEERGDFTSYIARQCAVL